MITFNEAISLTNIIKDEINEKVKFDPSSGLLNPNYKYLTEQEKQEIQRDIEEQESELKEKDKVQKKKDEKERRKMEKYESYLKKLERQYIHELIDQNLGIQDNPYLRMSDQYKQICEIKHMLEDGNYNNDQALMEVARVKQTMTSNRRLQITNDLEPSTEIVIASENIEDYATRKSRCPTLRKKKSKKGKCKQ